ncbi:MAG: tripartite tricarboxylate transporter substrate binding protein [Nocardioides sp.]|nr:tripartite tricarboxylate transporter substrate binding protein [Nocardioides sp.]
MLNASRARRHLALRAVAGSLLAPLALTACQVSTGEDGDAAGDYPSKTINIVLGNAPGASTDINTRAAAPCLEEELGQTVVVMNKEGASGAVANREIMNSKPDGYTLGLNPATYLTLSPQLDDLGYSVSDFTPIAEGWGSSQILVARADGPFDTAEELLKAIEANPGKHSASVPGPTSPKGFACDLLETEYGLETKVVPLEGESDQHRALLAKDVDFNAVEAAKEVRAFLEDGRFIALAAIGPDRVNWLPDVPTLAELGYPNATVPDNRWGLYGPKGLPDDVVSTLEDAMETCMADPEVIKKIGEDFVNKEFHGHEEFATFLEGAEADFAEALSSRE